VPQVLEEQAQAQKPLWQRRKSHFCDYRDNGLEQICTGDSSCPRIFARIPSLAIFVFHKAFAAKREKLFCLLSPPGWSPAGWCCGRATIRTKAR
jgi:hypothetical protein